MIILGNAHIPVTNSRYNEYHDTRVKIKKEVWKTHAEIRK